MYRRLDRRILILLLVAGLFSYEKVSASNRFQDCLGTIFTSIGKGAKKGVVYTRDSFVKFGSEVRRDGLSRLFYKDAKVIDAVTDTKLLGILRAQAPPDTHWFWRIEEAVTQWGPRKVTKAIYGKTYDFAPFSQLYRGGEKLLLPEGKTLTNGWKMAGYVAIYPLTFYGLFNRYLEVKEKEKALKDLDYLIDEDYRFRELKTKYTDQKKRRVERKPALNANGDVVYTDEERGPGDAFVSDAYREAFELKAQYELYFEVMKQLQKQGISYNQPASTMALFSDPELMKKIGPLFTDVVEISNQEFYVDKPYLDASHFKKPAANQVHELMKLNHLKLMLEASSYDLFKNPRKAPAALKKTFAEDPFYQSVLKLLSEKKIRLSDAVAAFDQKIEWATRLSMFKVVGVVPYRLLKGQVTDQELVIADLEAEILQKLVRAKK